MCTCIRLLHADYSFALLEPCGWGLLEFCHGLEPLVFLNSFVKSFWHKMEDPTETEASPPKIDLHPDIYSLCLLRAKDVPCSSSIANSKQLLIAWTLQLFNSLTTITI